MNLGSGRLDRSSQSEVLKLNTRDVRNELLISIWRLQISS